MNIQYTKINFSSPIIEGIDKIFHQTGNFLQKQSREKVSSLSGWYECICQKTSIPASCIIALFTYISETTRINFKSYGKNERDLELVSEELNHFGLIAGLFRQIGGHSRWFVLFCSFWILFTKIMIKSVKVFPFSFWKIIIIFFFYFIKIKPPA